MREAKNSQCSLGNFFGADMDGQMEARLGLSYKKVHNDMLRIYWIAPNLNHYKKKFLARLVSDTNIDIIVLAGKTPSQEGHRADDRVSPFPVIQVSVIKRWFSLYPPVYRETLKAAAVGLINAFMVPAEKRLFPLILWLFILRTFFRFKLVTYTHPFMRSRPDRVTSSDLFWTKLIFALFDRVIFYTEESRDWALQKQLLPAAKADYANNTLDTEEIWRHYNFEINLAAPKRILFIGRLIANKRLELLLHYFRLLKKDIPDLELTVIGDGPNAGIIENAAKTEPDLTWLGMIVEESEISSEMKRSHIVFIPGWSGLSVVHAFAYGKPYVTLTGMMHAPEVSYLKHGANGYLLANSETQNVALLRELLTDDDQYGEMCRQAYKTAQMLSINRWCERMNSALRATFKINTI